MNVSTEADVKKKDKMDVGSAIAYSIGFGGTNVVWYMINNYLMLFYTDVVSLSAGVISTILLIARIWDAINDPMMGAIVDRTHSRWGKFKPYIVMGAPFLAIFNILTFTVWPLEGTTKAVVCLLAYIGVGTLVLYQGDDRLFGAYVSKEDVADTQVTTDQIPPGRYLIGYHRGAYETIGESFSRIRAAAPECKVADWLVAQNIVDQFVQSDRSEYITEIQMPIL